MREQLDDAINNEDYELAAAIRDKLETRQVTDLGDLSPPKKLNLQDPDEEELQDEDS